MRSSKPKTVLVHGLSAKRYAMIPLNRWMHASGLQTSIFSYPSTRGTITDHASSLARLIAEWSPENVLAHSMGSALVRLALAMSPVEVLPRCVFLAPPMSGTPVARWGSHFAGSLIPILNDLSDTPVSVVNQIKHPSELEFATIAARFDLLVPIANTCHPDERDRRVLNATHNSLLLNKSVATHCVNFFNAGCF